MHHTPVSPRDSKIESIMYAPLHVMRQLANMVMVIKRYDFVFTVAFVEALDNRVLAMGSGSIKVDKLDRVRRLL